MVFCEECGFENEDGYVFCAGCGAKRKEAPAQQGTQSTGAPAYAQQPVYMQPIGAGYGQNAAARRSSFLSGADLIDPEEKVVAQLGNGYLSNAITYRKAGSIGVTLTDRRVYLKGRFINGGDEISHAGIFGFWFRFRDLFKRKMNDQILDIRDVTGTWFEYVDDVWFIILAIFWGIAMIVFFVIGLEMYDDYFALAGGSVIFIVVNILAYFLSRHTDFCIEYAGGTISFNADIVGVPAVRDFHKQLRRVKDHHMDLLEGRK